MSLNHPKSGLNLAAEFQVSALPYVTSSQVPTYNTGFLEIQFPKVTKFITVTNLDGSKLLRIAFAANGLKNLDGNGHHFKVLPSSTVTLDLRVKSLWLASETGPANVSICAGLTNVDAINMPTLTGSLGDGTISWVGVG